MTTTVPLSAPAPDEGEMEKLITILARQNGSVYELYPAECREISSYIRSLHSRLKQVEAERDSYRGDAEKMYGALEFIRTQDVPFEKDTTLHLEAREIADKALSPLSHHYPSNK